MVIFLNVGDFVGRKSYNCDVVFVINKIIGNVAILQGYYIRLIADSPLEDLVIIKQDDLKREEYNDNEYKKSIIDNYIYKYEETDHPNNKSSLNVINMVMNVAIIALSVVLSYMLYLVLK